MKVTPETLTDEMVLALQRSLTPGDDLHQDTCWHFASYVPQMNKATVRQRICDAINARANGGVADLTDDDLELATTVGDRISARVADELCKP